MVIQNVRDSITANPKAFLPKESYKRNNGPFLIDEYFMTKTAVSDYTTQVSVLDEDQNPIVTVEVDIYDDMDEVERQLAFVAALADPFRENITDRQLQAILDKYDLFMEHAQFPASPSEDFDDLRLVKTVIAHVRHGRTVEAFFAVPEPHRKKTRTDYSQNRFRMVATEIVEALQAAA